LSSRALRKIQFEHYKRQTNGQDIDREDSFFHFFSTDLLDLVKKPYREDATYIIHIDEVYDEKEKEYKLIANETFEYTCKKGIDGFQEYIKYENRFGTSELMKCKIKAILPKKGSVLNDKEYETEIEIQDIKGIDNKIYPILLQDLLKKIEKYDPSSCTEVRIVMELEYVLKKDKFHTRHMTFPTYDVQIHITAPKGFEIVGDVFANKDDGKWSFVQKRPHVWSFISTTWMLPHNGFVFRVYQPENKKIIEEPEDTDRPGSQDENDTPAMSQNEMGTEETENDTSMDSATPKSESSTEE